VLLGGRGGTGKDVVSDTTSTEATRHVAIADLWDLPVSASYPGPADGYYERPTWVFAIDASAWTALLTSSNWSWLVSAGILRANN
jgi:hypothetical protein